MSSSSFGAKFSLPPLAKSLSLKLLLLTVFFVMLAEILIYCPSVGRFRLVYLEERLGAAHLAILALEATPNQNVGVEMEERLMAHVGAYAVSKSVFREYSEMVMTDPASWQDGLTVNWRRLNSSGVKNCG